METSGRVNHRLLIVNHISFCNGCVTVNYTIRPFFYQRVAVYDITELVEYLQKDSKQKANSLDFLMLNFNEIIQDHVAEFHYKQCSISLKRMVENLSREVKYLRDQIEKIITKQ
ncbi:MAG: hypothetical protein VYB44_07450 [Bacteroidota bacterium]|nr:hypothetical protein [Bacteroidota bacterium]